MIWMQRENESADSNHSLSYARSKDLEHWTICGEKHSKAPLNHTNRFIVEKGIDDRTRKFKGLLNNRQNFNVLKNGTVIISFLMQDKQGMQVFNAFKPKESCNWTTIKATNWCSGGITYGRGSLSNEDLASFSPVFEKRNEEGGSILVQNFNPSRFECSESKPLKGTWKLNSQFSPESFIPNPPKKDKEPERSIERYHDSSLPHLTKNMVVYDKNSNRKIGLNWLAKENTRDLAPICLGFTCKTRDFVSPLYLLKKDTLNDWTYIRLVDRYKQGIKAWGGSQSRYEIGKIGDKRYAIYYAEDYCLTFGIIAGRTITESICLNKVKNKWDSHNYVTSFIIDDQSLYVAGNMHNSPLELYKIDIESLNITKFNLDKNLALTYPKFLKIDNKTLLMLRNGKSGNGSQIIYEILANGTVIEHSKLFDHKLRKGQD
jgi:hypothetical protein